MTRPVLRPVREIRSWPPARPDPTLPWWLWALLLTFLAACGYSMWRGLAP